MTPLKSGFVFIKESILTTRESDLFSMTGEQKKKEEANNNAKDKSVRSFIIFKFTIIKIKSTLLANR